MAQYMDLCTYAGYSCIFYICVCIYVSDVSLTLRVKAFSSSCIHDNGIFHFVTLFTCQLLSFILYSVIFIHHLSYSQS